MKTAAAVRCSSCIESRTLQVTRHTKHVTRHTSHVTRHTSHVTRHTSHVTCSASTVILKLLSSIGSYMLKLLHFCTAATKRAHYSSPNIAASASCSFVCAKGDASTTGIHSKTNTTLHMPRALLLRICTHDTFKQSMSRDRACSSCQLMGGWGGGG